MYELVTGHEPYHEFEGDDIRLLYASQTFPDTASLGKIGYIIGKRWRGRYSGCDGLLADLEGMVLILTFEIRTLAYTVQHIRSIWVCLVKELSLLPLIAIGIAGILIMTLLFSRRSARVWFPWGG